MSKYSKLKQMSEIDIQLKKLEKAIDKTSFLFEDDKNKFLSGLTHMKQELHSVYLNTLSEDDA